MSASNFRNGDPNTVHHVTSRIAHRVYFLGDEQKNDLMSMLRRASEFSGVVLLGWALLDNHLHLLLHLPFPRQVDESEVLRRFAVLKGSRAAEARAKQLAEWRAAGDEQSAGRWFDAQRRRMYDVGEFMKIVKQWFTEEYNRREAHVGTLWEGVYHDKFVPMSVDAMSSVLAYVDLNPIRAAACSGLSDYPWSSFSAAKKGDATAVAGLRFVYQDEESPVEELVARHEFLMEDRLESWKRCRAEDIARRRAAGFEAPADPLTDEARIAQAAVHLKEVQDALVEMRQRGDVRTKRKEKRANSEHAVLVALRLNPSLNAQALAEAVGLSVSFVYDHLKALAKRGAIVRVSRKSPWIVNESAV